MSKTLFVIEPTDWSRLPVNRDITIMGMRMGPAKREEPGYR